MTAKKIKVWTKGSGWVDTFAVPTPFGKERAKEIWKNRDPHDNSVSKNMTPGEIAYVHEVWETLKDTASFSTAFTLILFGKK